jgi:tetratricopeptide (TPR) repeat protein
MNSIFFRKFAAPPGGLALLLAALVLGCASGPPDIPEELSPAELIQRGQEASDWNRYKQALYYYEAIVERYPTDMESVCAAEYEIAFIHYKQKKYDEARQEFKALIARYSGPGAESLPPAFKRLAEIVLAKIPEPVLGPTGEG